jgi:membrane protein
MRTSLIEFGKRVYAEADHDEIFNGAAALAYFWTLAIFPAMIFLMAVIPYLPIAQVDRAVMDLLRQALPPSAADMFTGVVRKVTSERRGGLLSLGLVVALWSASTGMYAIMRQLNIAFNVAERRPFVKARVTALLLTLLFGVLVIGAFSLIVLGGVLQDFIGNRVGFSDPLMQVFAIFRWVVIVLALLLSVSLIYRFAPNRHVSFRMFTAGGITATLLLIAASFGFSLYTSNFANYSAVYGSVGAVIVLMLWLYIAGLVILLGAEMNVVLEREKPGAAGTVQMKPDPVAEQEANEERTSPEGETPRQVAGRT